MLYKHLIMHKVIWKIKMIWFFSFAFHQTRINGCFLMRWVQWLWDFLKNYCLHPRWQNVLSIDELLINNIKAGYNWYFNYFYTQGKILEWFFFIVNVVLNRITALHFEWFKAPSFNGVYTFMYLWSSLKLAAATLPRTYFKI